MRTNFKTKCATVKPTGAGAYLFEFFSFDSLNSRLIPPTHPCLVTPQSFTNTPGKLSMHDSLVYEWLYQDFAPEYALFIRSLTTNATTVAWEPQGKSPQYSGKCGTMLVMEGGYVVVIGEVLFFFTSFRGDRLGLFCFWLVRRTKFCWRRRRVVVNEQHLNSLWSSIINGNDTVSVPFSRGAQGQLSRWQGGPDAVPEKEDQVLGIRLLHAACQGRGGFLYIRGRECIADL